MKNLFVVIDTKYLNRPHMLIVLPPLELIYFCSERPTAQKRNDTMLQNINFAVETLSDFSSLSYDLLVADWSLEITGLPLSYLSHVSLIKDRFVVCKVIFKLCHFFQN